MTTRADALEVMTLVVACHHRSAPRMDDEQATLATAQVWAELFSVGGFQLPDLIAAVKKRALSEADAPEPAEIIRYARDIRAERTQRESAEERAAREDRQDRALSAQEQGLSIANKSIKSIQRAARDFGISADESRRRIEQLVSGFGKEIPDA